MSSKQTKLRCIECKTKGSPYEGYKCNYCKNFCCDHSHFIPYNQDTTIDMCNGMKYCCSNKFCMILFEHEKIIKRQEVMNDFDTSPRKYFDANEIQYLDTWLDKNDKRLKLPKFANPYKDWA